MVREKYQNFSEEEREKSKYITEKDIEIFFKKKKKAGIWSQAIQKSPRT